MMCRYFFLCFITLFTACSNLYFGYSKEEWNALSESDREKAKAEYKKVIDEKDKISQGNPREEASKNFVERAIEKSGN